MLGLNKLKIYLFLNATKVILRNQKNFDICNCFQGVKVSETILGIWKCEFICAEFCEYFVMHVCDVTSPNFFVVSVTVRRAQISTKGLWRKYAVSFYTICIRKIVWWHDKRKCYRKKSKNRVCALKMQYKVF